MKQRNIWEHDSTAEQDQHSYSLFFNMSFLLKRSTVIQGTDGLGKLRQFPTPPRPCLYKEMLQGKANI